MAWGKPLSCANLDPTSLARSMDLIELSTTGLALLIVFFLLRVLSVQQFRDSIPGMILLTVAGAFGIARAMTSTGGLTAGRCVLLATLQPQAAGSSKSRQSNSSHACRTRQPR
jgi:di/tricarboxylate transporter